jgi:plastocyanin
MRQRRRTTFFLVLCCGGLLPVALAAAPNDGHPPTAADVARLEADLARVQREVREQRQLILQLMQMHDALLKYVQLGGGAGSSSDMAVPPAPSATSPAPGRPPELPGPSVPGAAKATLSGSVRSTVGTLGESYVYVDGPRSVATRPSTIEIKQFARQFVPTLAVVQVGTRVLFPNEDRIFHNVFSRTPGDAFDLGSVKPGDHPNPIVLLKPGHVEVFCNIHSKMRADVLVVPNAFWARVQPDGSFKIPGLPVGNHKIVLWGPSIKPVTQRIDVTAAGANMTFSAESQVRRAHLNKQGGAYESYED